MSNRAFRYRSDIDGLRALAVMLVVIYHSGFRYLPGGYVGVDVFFVISGYLITLHIVSELNAGTFSLGSFYERRIRRIFPALLVMLFVSSVLAYLFMLPGELADYAKSLISAALSASNFYFWRQSGYFDAPATMKPLLHTWSLAVEEQFYLLFPLLLMALHKIAPRRMKMSIVVLVTLSLVISVLGVTYFKVANFFLAPSRAWELLLGSMLALEMVSGVRSKILEQLGSALGLVLILGSAFYYSDFTPFPGLAALAPCLGAALIIRCRSEEGSTLTARLLSLKPIVFIGLISYSLYLWHWPVIVFQSISPSLNSGHPLQRLMPFLTVAHSYIVERLINIVGLSLVLGTLSWQFVEKPFRVGVLRMPRPALFSFFAVSTGCLLVLGGVLTVFRGFPARFSPQAIHVASYLSTLPDSPKGHYREHICFLTGGDEFQQYDRSQCLQEDPSRKNWLLIGDSHGAQLDYGLSTVLKDVNVMQATASGCKPVMANKPGESESCVLLNKYIFDDYIPSHHPDKLLIAARWDSADLSRLGKTIKELQAEGIDVVIFGPIMEYDLPLPRLLAMSIQNNKPGLTAQHRLLSYDELDREMALLARDVWGVEYISYESQFCTSGNCLEYAAPDIPLQSDTAHLTDAGSVLVADKLRLANQ